jgi:hypothetical protein
MSEPGKAPRSRENTERLFALLSPVREEIDRLKARAQSRAEEERYSEAALDQAEARGMAWAHQVAWTALYGSDLLR